jgi:hypothetical protein
MTIITGNARLYNKPRESSNNFAKIRCVLMSRLHFLELRGLGFPPLQPRPLGFNNGWKKVPH